MSAWLARATDSQLDQAIAANQARVGSTELPENIRLVLQCTADSLSEWKSQYPMWLSGTQEEAVRLGLLDEIVVRGRINWRLTPSGRERLLAANAALGARATRYVHALVQEWFMKKPMVLGYPFLVPLTRRVDRYRECLVVRKSAPQKSLLHRLFGL